MVPRTDRSPHNGPEHRSDAPNVAKAHVLADEREYDFYSCQRSGEASNAKYGAPNLQLENCGNLERVLLENQRLRQEVQALKAEVVQLRQAEVSHQETIRSFK